ncbi:MAG: PAS domain-containing sensor histidine kinase [Chloroflexota bacterium]
MRYLNLNFIVELGQYLIYKPVFRDFWQNTIAVNLWFSHILSGTSLISIAILVNLYDLDVPITNIAIYFFGTTTICSILLAYHKRIELSAIVLLCSAWLALAIAVWMRGGLYVPSFRFFNIIILVSALLIKPRWGLYMFSTTIIFAIVLVFTGRNEPGILMDLEKYITESILFDIMILMMSAGVAYIMSYNFRNAHTSLQQANHALREQQVQLQTYVDELHRSQKQQQHAQEKLLFQSHLLNSVTASIIASDMNNTIIYWGDGAEQIHGYTKEEAIFRNFNELMGQPEDQFAEIQAALNSAGYWQGEQQFTCKDGSLLWLDSSISMVANEQGTPVAIVGCAIEINQRKQVERELRLALEEAQELNVLKSRFISMISHEFRTPLATIYASSQMLDRNFDQLHEAQRAKRFKRISTQIAHMTSLIDDALTIGYMDSGTLKLQRETFSLSLFIDEISQDFAYLHSHYELEKDHPQGDRMVHLDRRLCRQILNNLLSNAAKYSRKGSTILLQISVEQCDNNGLNSPTTESITFLVQDEGIGIPIADRERLFEPFHRATNVGNIQGTGLGLSITKRAVEMHGGAIAVKSQESVGSTFCVRIPMNEIKVVK